MQDSPASGAGVPPAVTRLRARDGRIYRATHVTFDGCTVLREIPKVRGKAARAADKRQRREARERKAHRENQLRAALAVKRSTQEMP